MYYDEDYDLISIKEFLKMKYSLSCDFGYDEEEDAT